MSHECVIGLIRRFTDDELATLAMVKEEAQERIRRNKELRELGIPIERTEWTLRDYADWRKRTNLTRFNYCPECGKKIDWGAIRKEEPT